MDAIVSKIQRWLPRKKLDIFGPNSLLMTCVPYYILALLTLSGLMAQRPQPFVFVAIIYAVFPFIDQIFSLDARNPDQKERRQLERNDWYFRMALYAAMLMSWVSFFKVMHDLSTRDVTWSNLYQTLGMTFIIANLYASQFAVAHQVMHKPSKFYRVLATLHMAKLFYPHFTYHHLHGHHHQVATPDDPSTSLKGETVYQFIPRCIRDSWIGVYRMEKKKGKSIWTNYAVLSIVSSVCLCVFIYLVYGLQSLFFHVLMGGGSVIYLEGINYIQHYGLLRKKLPDGSYEKVTVLHSWNAPHRFSNYLLFKLQRHSDHHENSTKPYQTLVSLEKSPFLPHGYTLTIIMSFFPKVWFRIMDPLADAYGKLDADKGEEISPQVMEKAITETRKFLIELALSATGLLLLSFSGILA